MPGYTKKTVKVEGMTCSACEGKINRKIKALDGVIDVKISYVTSVLTVTFDEQKIGMDEIVAVIRKAGYDIVSEKPESQEKDRSRDRNFLMVSGVILLGLYLIIQNTIGFNFIPQVNQNMGYGILFLIGLLTSLHCVAMCGGVNLSTCMSYASGQDSSGTWSKLMPSFLYNSGRVVSYTVLGGIFGAFGSFISITNGGKAFISILAGVFMVIMGLNMLNIFPWLRKFNPHMPAVFAGKLNGQKQKKGPFLVGLLNGLMPCGPLQAMQIYALGTGSFIGGALSMFLFSLGTVPLMFAFGAVSSILSGKFTRNMMKASALLVVALGVVMLNRGVAFTGFTFSSVLGNSTIEASEKGKDTNTATMDPQEGIQTITTTLAPGRYTPITVEAGTPVKWTIVAESGSLNGCNNEIIIPEYGISKKLEEGDNVIEFTPSDTGAFGYSCWMGMIRSSITVLAAANTGELPGDGSAAVEEPSPEVDNSGLPAGCCGY